MITGGPNLMIEINGSTCNSMYTGTTSPYPPESALIINQSELYHALLGGSMGVPSGYTVTSGLACGGTNSFMANLPTSYNSYPAVMPSIIDTHVWISFVP